jgi:hypothetical protein
MYIPHIITSRSVIVTADTPISIDASHPNFDKVANLLTTSTASSLDQIVTMMKPIVEFNKAITTSSFYRNDYGVVSIDIDGYPFPLPVELQSEVLRINRATGDLTALTNFVTKLSQNPDKDVHQQLYGFIQACGLSLTLDGDFLAYKRVTSNLMDIYTRTMDNSPGKTVEMPRFAVDKDPNRTCSSGLHFAAWGYLAHYASADVNRTVIVKINPADVVSIPTDYNNMKGRAAKYYVLKEVETPEELKYRPVFDYEEPDYDFDEEYDVDNEDYSYDGYSGYAYDEALADARDIKQEVEESLHDILSSYGWSDAQIDAISVAAEEFATQLSTR